jgi:bacillithiol biosynthesis deacetylase BshB1
MVEPVDVLAIGAHPDDVEVAVGGLMLRWKAAGRRCAVVDLTAGERGTRGSAELRAVEAAAAAARLGLVERVQLGLPDARLTDDVEAREALATVVRRLRPRLLLAPWIEDRHPDHAAAGRLAQGAWFAAGLAKLDLPRAAGGDPGTTGIDPGPWRPERLWHYPLHTLPGTGPSLVLVPIDAWWGAKLELLGCYDSQFGEAVGRDAGPRLVGRQPLASFEARARELGKRAGCEFAEALLAPDGVVCADPLATSAQD